MSNPPTFSVICSRFAGLAFAFAAAYMNSVLSGANSNLFANIHLVILTASSLSFWDIV